MEIFLLGQQDKESTHLLQNHPLIIIDQMAAPWCLLHLPNAEGTSESLTSLFILDTLSTMDGATVETADSSGGFFF